jgi:hypothetical protein
VSKHKRFFDGTYMNENFETEYKVTTLTNPDGFLVTSTNGTTLTVTVDDALDLVDRLKKGGSYSLNDLVANK